MIINILIFIYTKKSFSNYNLNFIIIPPLLYAIYNVKNQMKTNNKQYEKSIEQQEKTLLKVETLLKEYQDIFPKDLPNKLSSK